MIIIFVVIHVFSLLVFPLLSLLMHPPPPPLTEPAPPVGMIDGVRDGSGPIRIRTTFFDTHYFRVGFSVGLAELT
jgi:hypothetical protein